MIDHQLFLSSSPLKRPSPRDWIDPYQQRPPPQQAISQSTSSLFMGLSFHMVFWLDPMLVVKLEEMIIVSTDVDKGSAKRQNQGGTVADTQDDCQLIIVDSSPNFASLRREILSAHVSEQRRPAVQSYDWLYQCVEHGVRVNVAKSQVFMSEGVPLKFSVDERLLSNDENRAKSLLYTILVSDEQYRVSGNEADFRNTVASWLDCPTAM